jgi:hypothetical protein
MQLQMYLQQMAADEDISLSELRRPDPEMAHGEIVMTAHLAPPVHDASGGALPLDREPYLSLVQTVLSWPAPETTLQPRDYERLSLQLASQARVLAESLRRLCVQLPEASATRYLCFMVLGYAERRLSAPPRATAARVQNLARLVRALYERLDRLHAAAGPGHAVFSS